MSSATTSGTSSGTSSATRSATRDTIALAPNPRPGPDQPTQFLDILSAAFQNPNIAVQAETIEKLLQMQTQLEDRRARQAYFQAMADIKAHIPAVLKASQNPQTRSRYADLTQISLAVDPIISRHGISLSFGTDASKLEQHYGVTCLIMHKDGHSEIARVDIPIDNAGIKGTANKTNTHAFGSSLTYARRYLKMLIFDIATTDDDGAYQAQQNAKAAKTCITSDQAAEIRALIDMVGADRGKLLNWVHVSEIEDIPAASFQTVKRALEAKKAAQNA